MFSVHRWPLCFYLSDQRCMRHKFISSGGLLIQTLPATNYTAAQHHSSVRQYLKNLFGEDLVRARTANSSAVEGCWLKRSLQPQQRAASQHGAGFRECLGQVQSFSTLVVLEHQRWTV
jgi:hypothetical protein